MSRPSPVEGQRMLVVGARAGSLGAHVAQQAAAVGYTVLTAGVTNETHRMDVTNRTTTFETVQRLSPDHVVCTVGINHPHDMREGSLYTAMMEHWHVNVMGVLNVLEAFMAYRRPYASHFVAVSSNSAHIARTKSAPYCTSKAALSMLIRCAARELADNGAVIWAVEPGLLDTAMTLYTSEFFDGALHRIPGLKPREGLSAANVARHIVTGISVGDMELNGTTLRLDGGEQ